MILTKCQRRDDQNSGKQLKPQAILNHHSAESIQMEWSRRDAIKTAAMAAAGGILITNRSFEALSQNAPHAGGVSINLRVNGRDHSLTVDSRTTLLDALRERLDLTGTKKGCDHGQCGACTVHTDGRRTLACLTLAAMAEGSAITTIEGISDGTTLHPMQAAFVKHDALQCGYCTPGQIMSAVALILESPTLSQSSIAEEMAGNLCRCGAYAGIREAIAEVRAHSSEVSNT